MNDNGPITLLSLIGVMFGCLTLVLGWALSRSGK